MSSPSQFLNTILHSPPLASDHQFYRCQLCPPSPRLRRAFSIARHRRATISFIGYNFALLRQGYGGHSPLLAFGELWRMEAGGFEPPSRDISGQASTCVVGHLRFARAAADRQAAAFARFAMVSPPCRERFRAAIPLSTPSQNPREEVLQDGRLIKQPLHTGSCQLKLVTED